MPATTLLLATLALGAQSDAPVTDEVHVVYASPGCLVGGSTHMHLASGLEEHFHGKSGSARVVALGLGALYHEGRTLFPDGDFTDPDAVARFLAADEAPARELIEGDLVGLDTAFETVVQAPRAGHFDALEIMEASARKQGRGGAIARVGMELVRYRAGASTVRALETEAARAAPFERDVARYVRQPAFVTKVTTPDDTLDVYSFGKRQGQPGRLKAELDSLRASLPAARTVVVHAGGAGKWRGDARSLALCGEAMELLAPVAIVPRASELELGVDGLAAFAREHGLIYVAANLRDVRAGGEGKLALPRFVTTMVDDRLVAVVGMVAESQVRALPAESRRQWRVDPPDAALQSALAGMREKMGRAPDLTVLVFAGNDDETDAGNLPGVDVVVGDFSRWGDLVSRREHVELLPVRAREKVPSARASLVVRAVPYGVGVVSGRFALDDGGERATLLSLTHENRVAVQDGPVDVEFARPRLAIIDDWVRAGAHVLLPDIDPIVRGDEELERLTFGESVLSHHGYDARPLSEPARFSDPLWMRLVTSAMRQATGAEVALALNLARGDDINGALPRIVLESWLPEGIGVEVVTLRGKELAVFAQWMKRQRATGAVEPRDHLFAAGYDVQRGTIGGRPVVADDPYRVVVTDAMRRVPALAEALGAARDVDARFRREGARFLPDDEGAPLSVRELVIGTLEQHRDPATGHFDASRIDEVKALLHDDGGVVEGLWALRLEDVAFDASAYRNSDNIGLFAGSRETRATTPNLFTLGARGRASLVYDGPWIAWDTGARLQYASVILDVPAQPLPPQEQRDDAVVHTELRINRIKLAVGGEGFLVIPFVRTALDTELSATPDPVVAGKTLPHQLLVQESLGLVAYPSFLFREVRLGGLVQQDLSELTAGALSVGALSLGAVHHDFGFVLGYRLTYPFWVLVFDSELDLRYLVPDFDDRVVDLGVRAQSVNKLMVPLGESFSLYVFLDVFLVSGKVPSTSELGFSAIAGGGLAFSLPLKLR